MNALAAVVWLKETVEAVHRAVLAQDAEKARLQDELHQLVTNANAEANTSAAWWSNQVDAARSPAVLVRRGSLWPGWLRDTPPHPGAMPIEAVDIDTGDKAPLWMLPKGALTELLASEDAQTVTLRRLRGHITGQTHTIDGVPALEWLERHEGVHYGLEINDEE